MYVSAPFLGDIAQFLGDILTSLIWPDGGTSYLLTNLDQNIALKWMIRDREESTCHVPCPWIKDLAGDPPNAKSHAPTRHFSPTSA